MKITQMSPGQVAYLVEKRDASILSLSGRKQKTAFIVNVYIKEVDVEKGYVIASVGNKRERKYYEYSFGKWKKEEPVMITRRDGVSKVATKKEILEMKNKRSK